jgi:hypothetical protein
MARYAFQSDSTSYRRNEVIYGPEIAAQRATLSAVEIHGLHVDPSDTIESIKAHCVCATTDYA